MARMRAGWDWRKASGGFWLATDHGPRADQRRFHAYDEDDHAACDPIVGLGRTCEEPDEGSDFCPACMEVVRTSFGHGVAHTATV